MHAYAQHKCEKDQERKGEKRVPNVFLEESLSYVQYCIQRNKKQKSLIVCSRSKYHNIQKELNNIYIISNITFYAKLNSPIQFLVAT